MTNQSGTRIAMWSGPRNISTALLRAWGNRSDAFVCDEPLYSHYLWKTRFAHPGADEIIERHERDWRKVVAWLTGEIPQGKAIFYQKQMAHHLLPEIDRGWLMKVTNCFLIREPREMLTSLLQVLPQPTLPDTGLPQQVEIFELVRESTGRMPPVLDSKDVLQNPRQMLGQLCAAPNVPFSDSMLHWPPGRRESDGVWAQHWYAAVERSTGFEPYRPKADLVPPEFEPLLAECEAYYSKLYEHRLR